MNSKIVRRCFNTLLIVVLAISSASGQVFYEPISGLNGRNGIDVHVKVATVAILQSEISFSRVIDPSYFDSIREYLAESVVVCAIPFQYRTSFGYVNGEPRFGLYSVEFKQTKIPPHASDYLQSHLYYIQLNLTNVRVIGVHNKSDHIYLYRISGFARAEHCQFSRKLFSANSLPASSDKKLYRRLKRCKLFKALNIPSNVLD